MRLADGARVAVVGAGPSGLVVAKHALDAGLDVTIFEASDDLGGQWNTSADHSGVWPDMPTNTSRAMTAFSDLDPLPDAPLHPRAVQIHAYLHAYADAFGLAGRVRLGTRVARVTRAREVDGERYDGVVIASGRFRRPAPVGDLGAFGGDAVHAFDYPGADAYRGRRVLVYGNGVSGLEIASDLAAVTDVVSAFRKPRYVIQKVVDGVPSDWQWYTAAGALERRLLPRDELSRTLRERVLRVAGHPSDRGAPEPDPNILVAGLSLCQDYLAQVESGRIVCRPAIATITGNEARFTDGTTEVVDAAVWATGYDLHLPYLDADVWDVVGPGLALHQRTLHPDLPGFGFVGQFLTQGPYLPLLELQARWIVGLWSGDIAPPSEARMRAAIAASRPPLDTHHALALLLAEEMGIAPDVLARPDLAEPLLFGPLLPARWRIDGPGARPDAPARFAAQVATSPRVATTAADVEGLRRLGLAEEAGLVAAAIAPA